MNIYSIIVAYHPDPSHLRSLCDTLASSGSQIMVIDNSSPSSLAEIPGCTLVPLGTNSGIAFAQNTGIRMAIGKGADIICFFDQDSLVDAAFLPKLTAPLQSRELAVTASVFFDAAKGFEFPAYRVNAAGWPVKVFSNEATQPYPADIITSSGSAATVGVFSRAGLMDEDFFIDYVDIEWSLRCKRNDVPILIVPDAVMKHTIGQQTVDFGVFRGFIHGPARSYYKIRNLFLLFRKNSVPFLYAAREMTVVMLHHILQLMLVKRKGAYLRYFFRSVKDGLKNVRGKEPE